MQFPCLDSNQTSYNLIWTLSNWSVDQNASGSGRPSRNDLNKTSDRSGCENGASCDAPLIVAKESILPYTWVHPPTWKQWKTFYQVIVPNTTTWKFFSSSDMKLY